MVVVTQVWQMLCLERLLPHINLSLCGVPGQWCVARCPKVAELYALHNSTHLPAAADWQCKLERTTTCIEAETVATRKGAD